MRITTGKYKSRLISAPLGIRPTQGKVRKALFDILGDIEGLSFLELFAGSGAVGFEAVSRGASELALVEYNKACQLAINKNIESLQLKACSLYPQEAERAIRLFHKERRSFDIIFLDPPYCKVKAFRKPYFEGRKPCSGPREEAGESLTKKALQNLGACDILTPNGFIIIQHFKKDNLPETAGDLILFRQAEYGDTILSFYRKVTRNQLP